MELPPTMNKTETDNPFLAKEILALIHAGTTSSDDIDTRLGTSNDSPTLTESLMIADLQINSSLELLYAFTIQGDLVFKNVRIKGDLNLAVIDIEGGLVFDNLVVEGNVYVDQLRAKAITIKKIEVLGEFKFAPGDEFSKIDEK
jgi:hypothetical protein